MAAVEMINQIEIYCSNENQPWRSDARSSLWHDLKHEVFVVDSPLASKHLNGRRLAVG